MKRVFIDSNIPMYWAGRTSEFKEPCRRMLESVAGEELEGYASVGVLQEILYRFRHLKDMSVGRQIFDLFSETATAVLSVTEQDVYLARSLSEKHSCGPRGLLHLAVMINNSIATIISVDKDFDSVGSIERVDPLDFEGWFRAG